MKAVVLTTKNTEAGKIDLPRHFDEEIRPDLIKRAVLAVQANKRQPYGASPEAGKKVSVRVSKRRRDYRGSYGHGISRVPRKVLSRRGRRFNWVGAFAPGMVGGRKAHPPKAEKIWAVKINKKERKKAIRSAIAAAFAREIVEKRGHIVPKNYPFVLEDEFESIGKTKELREILKNIGFGEELKRAAEKKIRAGKGKFRGRKYRKKTSLLFVVSKDCRLLKAAKNIPGIDIEVVKNINAELLAPGAVPGRLTLFTKGAVEKLGGLFI